MIANGSKEKQGTSAATKTKRQRRRTGLLASSTKKRVRGRRGGRAPLVWHGCYDEGWTGIIVPGAFRHPAKFSKMLVERILDYLASEELIQPGCAIGDPFGGVGLGGIVASYRGYAWFGQELEPEFTKLGNENIEKHRTKLERLGVPAPVLVQGDSRQFAERINAILTSPPYIACGHHSDAMEGGNRNGRGQTRAIVTSPAYSNSLDTGGKEKQHPDGFARSNDWSGYGKTDGQIARLNPGDVDAVVTSSPFCTDQPCANQSKLTRKVGISGRAKRDTGMVTEGNIGRLAIVTSPPYETIAAGAGGLNSRPAKKDGQQSGRKASSASQSADQRYGQTDGQIARAAKGPVDALLTSPPYEDSINSKSHGIDFSKAKRDYPGRINHSDRNAKHAARADEMIYGDTEGQIGKLKKQTYWEAMAQVYASCYRTLRPGGVMVVVVKDFVKRGKRMTLCDDTMRLLLWLGFEEYRRIRAMLVKQTAVADLFEGERTEKVEKKSFFRRVHEKRLAPDDPRRIDWEEVLIVRKPE